METFTNPYINETPVNGVAKVGDKVRFFGEHNRRGIVQTVVAVPVDGYSISYQLQNPTSEIPGFSELGKGWTFAEESETILTPTIHTHPEFFKK